MNIDRSVFIPMLTVGLILWQFIAGSITESSSLFVRQSALVRKLQLPVIIVVLLILGHTCNLNQLYVLPSIYFKIAQFIVDDVVDWNSRCTI